MACKVDPHAPSSRKAYEAIAALANARNPTGISLSPIIPGLNDEEVFDLLARTKQAGAVEVMATLLRLSSPVEPVFTERMAELSPDRITKITNRIQLVLGRAIRNGTFFERHCGADAYRAMIEQLLELAKRRAGVPVLSHNIVSPATFRRSVSNKSPYFEAG